MLSQFDLNHSLTAGGMLGKDVQDQRDSINHITSEDLFEIALLGWT
tara:strand:- start:123 stop:260 length:138 start_codon:yes stop_codon:yes gene_type:complete